VENLVATTQVGVNGVTLFQLGDDEHGEYHGVTSTFGLELQLNPETLILLNPSSRKREMYVGPS